MSAGACAALISWCGKTQVGAAALDVERDAEAVQRDGGALDVPAGPARAERPRRPTGLALAARPPQQRVERVALARPVGVSPALGEDAPSARVVEAGDRAERVGRLRDVEVEVLRRRRDASGAGTR